MTINVAHDRKMDRHKKSLVINSFCPYYMFLIFFSLKSLNRLDFIICWFSLDLIAEKSIKIFFYEIKFWGKVEPHYHIAQILTFITYLNEEHE